MKILLIHNSYLERGGEDGVVDAQINLLKEQGHSLIVYRRHNEEVKGYNALEHMKFFAKEALWSDRSYLDVKSLIRRDRPDIALVHNIFYVISPSVYQACYQEKVPVIQHFHNYRWLLDSDSRYDFMEFQPMDFKGFVLRYNLVPRILKRINRDDVYGCKVHKFVCLSKFSKRIFTGNGFEKTKISVLPPSVTPADRPRAEAGSYALFVGRLVEYKGIRVLLKAMRKLPGCHLRVIGEGPLRAEVQAAAKQSKNIDYVGSLPHQEMLAEMKKCAFLVFPSLCYETFGNVLVEAFSCGVPVVGSRQTTAEEIIDEGKTGLLFRANDPHDLAAKMEKMFQNPSKVRQMGEAAYQVCLKQYSPQKHYEKLNSLLEEVLRERK